MSGLGFVALGTPAAQGSKRHVGKGVMVEMNKNLRPWRDTVTWTAREAMPDGWTALDEPVALAAWFFFAKPKSAPKSLDHKPTAPDLDKLLRALGDSLTAAGVWRDDSRCVWIEASKHYPYDCGLDVPGVVVGVASLDDEVGAATYAVEALRAFRAGGEAA